MLLHYKYIHVEMIQIMIQTFMYWNKHDRF